MKRGFIVLIFVSLLLTACSNNNLEEENNNLKMQVSLLESEAEQLKSQINENIDACQVDKEEIKIIEDRASFLTKKVDRMNEVIEQLKKDTNYNPHTSCTTKDDCSCLKPTDPLCWTTPTCLDGTCFCQDYCT